MIQILTIATVVWREVLRRKDVYVLFILLGALLTALISLDVFGLGGTTRYIKDSGLLMTWLFSIIMALSIAGRQLPREEEKGTIFPLLAKPVTRMNLLLGKWLGSWTVTGAATAACYALTVLVVVLKKGSFDGIPLAQAMLLHGMALGLLCALTITLSTRLTASAAITLSAIFSGTSLLVVPDIPRVIAGAPRISREALLVLYYALPHLELFDLRRRVVHDWGVAPWSAVGLSLLYGLCWTAILLLLAWLCYRRKYFRRGARL